PRQPARAQIGAVELRRLQPGAVEIEAEEDAAARLERRQRAMRQRGGAAQIVAREVERRTLGAEALHPELVQRDELLERSAELLERAAGGGVGQGAREIGAGAFDQLHRRV